MEIENHIGVVLPAGGIGSRLSGGRKKQYRKIGGKEIFLYTLENIFEIIDLKEVVIVLTEDDREFVQELIQKNFPDNFEMIQFAIGGKSRQESVKNGLLALSSSINIVAIHDIVRPFASPKLFNDVISKVKETNSAVIVGMPATDTVKKIDGEHIEYTLYRQNIFLAQTPQVFPKELILHSHEQVSNLNMVFTDDSHILEYCAIPVKVMAGEDTNIKITNQFDLILAELILNSKKTDN
ncbi:MAG: 2-C-methyl-D-erythritol 4-phosphate cytidylyltransferase [Planctomycetota bacterium]|nr:MAG: 2-C-methyl-D-erythritol 4-phosphate cytidylyltransferase [Planctomycetota bacterium]